tara:strand:- start:1351 stop:1848 length:498 start_codon:yes stop_codon:yes gene_type:complete
MTITSAIANSFKVEILQGGHNFNDASGAPTGNTFKIALYSSDSAALSKSTTVYTAPADGTADPTNTYEVTSTSSGYTTGGENLVSTADPVLSGDTACVKFNDISWSSASFTARGCLIYNSTAVTGFTTNRAVCAVNFGADKTVTSGTFTVQFPAQTAGNAIVQIA